MVRQHRERVEQHEDFSDLEAELETRHAMGKIDVLKQVVTDPDYVGKQQFFNKSSPKPLSVQEQKAQALNKLAAFKKSADVLTQIKSRLGKDEQMKNYLVKELSQTVLLAWV